MSTFFYDKQIRRFIYQFVRVFSHFEVEYGQNEHGTRLIKTVPVRYGEGSRMANTILRNNSENAINAAPMISCYIDQMEYARDRVQDPTFVGNMHIRQRKKDPETGIYTTKVGNAYTIERLMPVPYKIVMKVDIWAANQEQKLQLFEQISAIFNPSLEIQSTDNYVDWTSLSVIELTGVQWSSRSVPSGAEESPDILTFTFDLPIWISSPAKVKKLGVIQKIIASVYDASGGLSAAAIDNGLLFGIRTSITPMDYNILLSGNQLQLLRPNNIVVTSLNTAPVQAGSTRVAWPELLTQFGTLQPGISQIKLLNADDTIEIVGTIAAHPSDPTILLYTPDPDTYPTNDLAAINAIIDPLRSGPGVDLPAAVTGVRYLILEDIGNINNIVGSTAWNSVGSIELIAKANDIIEFDGTNWTVSFVAANSSGIHYCTNLTTGVQYKRTPDNWIKSIDGAYPALKWTLVL